MVIALSFSVPTPRCRVAPDRCSTAGFHARFKECIEAHIEYKIKSWAEIVAWLSRPVQQLRFGLEIWTWCRLETFRHGIARILRVR
jgi:hypothetical protein